MKIIDGGVTAPLGFRAAGVHCGIRKSKMKKDLALIAADMPCRTAAIYTTNQVKGAPIAVTRRHLADGMARAIVCNSGNANTCNTDGEEKALEMCALAAEALGIDTADVLVASTGVIGQPLPIDPIREGMPGLVAALSKQGGDDAAEAIMTTDTRKKQIAVEIELDGRKVTIGAMAKGSGMICPNMATMLAFVTTDAAIDPALMQEMLQQSADRSINCVSVDGDTSTNDMLFLMASGLAGNAPVSSGDDNCRLFAEALDFVTVSIAKMLAADGEGATRLIQCHVRNARSETQARILAKAVIQSPLVKTAVFGADANWGRILCAMGYSSADFVPSQVDVLYKSALGEILVCQNGGSIDFDEERAAQILSKDDITIDIDIKMGGADGWAWGCDLSYEYVRINGDYRT
jgi:glutamate N-acetyltransferase/amino-acid N-acetyltransferase